MIDNKKLNITKREREMAKLKVRRIHKAICPTCRGNGYIRIKDNEDPTEVNVHQCWECDSEGEFYVYEPANITDDNTSNDDRNNDKFLH